MIIKFILDRDRLINYNGEKLYANTYRCSGCDFTYVMQTIHIKYCPNCGVKFEKTEKKYENI